MQQWTSYATCPPEGRISSHTGHHALVLLLFDSRCIIAFVPYECLLFPLSDWIRESAFEVSGRIR